MTPAFRLDTRGSAAVEFALVAPTFLFMLLGLFDIGHTLFMRSAVQGALQKAARDSALETNTAAARLAIIDDSVRAQAKALARNARIDIKRRFYRSFSDAAAARAESWTDTNRDGRCNLGEPYEDTNLNGMWDADGGNAGQGGAKDATLVTVTVEYPHMFPLMRVLNGGNDDVRIIATTVLRNQPYADQSSYATAVRRNCA